MSCADVQTIQAGNGSKTQFSFDFPYILKTEIKVYFWNDTTKEWDEKLTTDATYPWQVTDANPTIVEFTSTAPPSPTAPDNVDNVRIRRVTKIDDIKALFSPGSAIRSDDLNRNFEQLRYAIQESNCQEVPESIYEFVDDYYWNNYADTVKSSDAWDSSDTKIATTAALDARFQDEVSETIRSDETWVENDDTIPTTLAAAVQFDTLVQTGTPSGSGYPVGKTWLQNDDDLTLSIWNGSAWLGLASGGTFTNQPQVVYVDANSGDDNNDGHRISRPKASIKAAINQINADATYGDGSVVIVAAGVYQEAAPIQIDKKNVSIIGQALRSCIVHPTSATETNTLFELNSGSYVANLTLTGIKAGTGTGNTLDATLPTTQGWNFAFRSGATITKSPYIQNCTNFSDSEIDNDNLNAVTPAGGAAGDIDSAPTGGGLLVNGATVSSSSPLRSMVCDSYTHVGLNGPGILVTNNGYVQATSSYAFFNKYHIKCLNGGQANLAASTTDFGNQALVADGRSTTAIFSGTVQSNASAGATVFRVHNLSADASWHGSATRPQSNMLVEVNGDVYPILSATAHGASSWDVEISNPDPTDRSNNLGLISAVSSSDDVDFFLRSMIASSGHTMEYVGSGTDYRALPENGGVPIEANQVVESNDGKIWTATTDHNGKFKVGDFFEVDQQLGYVTIPEGSIAFDLLSDATPQLGGDLDVLARSITTSTTDGNITLNPNGTGTVDVSSSRITSVTDPTGAQDAATKNYVDTQRDTRLALSGGTMTGDITFNSGQTIDGYVPQTSTTGSAEVPSGTEAERDGSPSAGYLRFNTDTDSFEGYDGTDWGNIGGGASAGGAIYENSNTISANYTLTTGTNGMSAGPITINSGVTVTVPSGQSWVIV